MTTKSQAEKIIALHNGAIDWEVSYITRTDKTVVIDAPEGHTWLFSGAESIVIGWYSGSAAEFWDEVIDCVSYGIEKD